MIETETRAEGVPDTHQTPIAAAVERELPPLGLTAGISDKEYHGGPGISKSGLDLISRSPLHYLTHKLHPKPDTPAYAVGKAFHSLTMEPDTWDDKYAVMPPTAPNRPTDRQINAKKQSPATIAAIDFWERWDRETEGKMVITNRVGEAGPFWAPGQYDLVRRMADSVREHPVASILLDPSAGVPEMSGYWIDDQTGKLCKVRPDFLNEAHNLVVDLKSCMDASYTEAGKSCGKWRYYVQDPYYLDGLRQCGRPAQGFVFVFVEKEPPFGIGVYLLNNDARHVGREVYRRNLDTYAACHTANDWPCYPPDIRDLEVPRWGLMERIG